MRNAWIGIEVIVRFECAFIPRCVIHVSVIFKRKQSRCEILEEGITEEIFAGETKEIDYFLQLELKLCYSEW